LSVEEYLCIPFPKSPVFLSLILGFLKFRVPQKEEEEEEEDLDDKTHATVREEEEEEEEEEEWRARK